MKLRIADIKKELSRKVNVKKVSLFGSRATGKVRRDSDYAIAVIFNDFKHTTFSERQRPIRLLIRKAIGTKPVNTSCYTEEESELGKGAFLPRIIEEERVAIS